MAIEVLTVDRKQKRVRLLAGKFTLTFVLIEGKVKLISRSVFKQRLTFFDDLSVPAPLYQEAVKKAYAILWARTTENKKGGTMFVPEIGRTQGNLFPGLTSGSPQKKRFRWVVEINGEQFPVNAPTQREAFAEAVSAVSPQYGRGGERRYRIALKMGARVVSKTPLY